MIEIDWLAWYMKSRLSDIDDTDASRVKLTLKTSQNTNEIQQISMLIQQLSGQFHQSFLRFIIYMSTN